MLNEILPESQVASKFQFAQVYLNRVKIINK